MRNSHEAIIDSVTFDKVQELLEENRTYRAKIRSSRPFSGKIICGDCGGFYGRKVWKRYNTNQYYPVWYCNNKYKREVKCQTYRLLENEIKEYFEQVLEMRGESDCTFSEARWMELVECVTVTSTGQMTFRLTDGKEYIIQR